MVVRARRSWLLATALLAVGCLSPTLPLPPPSEASVTTPDMQGLVHVSGTVLPKSLVFALNQNTQLASGQYTESGSYDFVIAAQPYDDLTIWYENSNVESPTIDVTVKAAPKTP